jgi:hypothetical protein
MATMGGFSSVPNPLVFSLSMTTLPEKMCACSSNRIATGSSVQWTRSRLIACPHDMLPHTCPSGLYW